MAVKLPTKAQRERWERIRALGCIIHRCRRFYIAIHHCDTGAGGRKDHDKVLPLCHYHHQGDGGIHTLGRKAWQAKHGTEQELMQQVEDRLNGKF